MRRRNPLTEDMFDKIMGAWRSQKPDSALATAIAADPAYRAKVYAVLAAIVAEAEAKAAAAATAEKAEAAAEKPGELTDREAWTQLAALCTREVLPDLTDAELAALRAAFLDEAAKA